MRECLVIVPPRLICAPLPRPSPLRGKGKKSKFFATKFAPPFRGRFRVGGA